MRLNFRRKPLDHNLHILDHTGDVKYAWNPANKASTLKVKQTFDELVSLGYLTYRADEDPTVIREFDPEAKTIIARKQMRGG